MDLLNLLLFSAASSWALEFICPEKQSVFFPLDLFSFALSSALLSGHVQVDVWILAELLYSVSKIKTHSDLAKNKLKEPEAL